MLTISKFPKSIAGRTKRHRGPHVGRVFETPGIGSRWFSSPFTFCEVLIWILCSDFFNRCELSTVNFV